VNTIGDSSAVHRDQPQNALPDTIETDGANDEIIVGSLIGR
jgi:hypothetical protein